MRGAVVFAGLVVAATVALPVAIVLSAVAGSPVGQSDWMGIPISLSLLGIARPAWRGEPWGRWLLVIFCGWMALGMSFAMTLEWGAGTLFRPEAIAAPILATVYGVAALVLWRSRAVRAFVHRHDVNTAPENAAADGGMAG